MPRLRDKEIDTLQAMGEKNAPKQKRRGSVNIKRKAANKEEIRQAWAQYLQVGKESKKKETRHTMLGRRGEEYTNGGRVGRGMNRGNIFCVHAQGKAEKRQRAQFTLNKGGGGFIKHLVGKLTEILRAFM